MFLRWVLVMSLPIGVRVECGELVVARTFGASVIVLWTSRANQTKRLDRPKSLTGGYDVSLQTLPVAMTEVPLHVNLGGPTSNGVGCEGMLRRCV